MWRMSNKYGIKGMIMQSREVRYVKEQNRGTQKSTEQCRTWRTEKFL